MKIGLKIKFFWRLGIFLLLVLVNSVISLRYFRTIQSSFEMTDKIYPVVKMIKDLAAYARESKNWAVRYTLEVDPVKLGQWRKQSQASFKEAITIFRKMQTITDQNVKRELKKINENLRNFSQVAVSLLERREDLAIHQFKVQKIREFSQISDEISENLKSLFAQTSDQKDLQNDIQNLRAIISENRALFHLPLFSPLKVQPEKEMRTMLLEKKDDFKTGMDNFDKRITAMFPKLTAPEQKRYLHTSKVLSLQMRSMILSDGQLASLYEREIERLLAIWKSVQALNVALAEVEKGTDKMSSLVNQSLENVRTALSDSQKVMVAVLFASIIIFILFGLLFNFFITKRVLRSVEELRASTDKIRAGQFDERVSVTSGDEIGELASAFNEMMDTLSKSRSEEQDLKNTVKELEEKNQFLTAANRTKAEFLSDTSHEFRTQLSNIIGFSDLLLRDPKEKLTPKAGKNLMHVLDSGRELLMMIEDMVDLSKISLGKLSLSIGEFDVAELLKDCWAGVTQEILAKGKDIQLAKAIPEMFPLCVSDADKVRKIMDHLLHNALKFMEKGTLSVSLEQQDPNFVITIKDTGVGISEGDQKIIFDEIKQMKASTPRALGASGIELLIVKKLVDALDGQIKVESETAEGVCFIVTLPLRYGERKKEAIVRKKAA